MFKASIGLGWGWAGALFGFGGLVGFDIWLDSRSGWVLCLVRLEVWFGGPCRLFCWAGDSARVGRNWLEITFIWRFNWVRLSWIGLDN